MEREVNARHTLLIEIYILLDLLKGVYHEIFNLHFFMIRAHLGSDESTAETTLWSIISDLGEMETDFENPVL